jgi:D-alanyl-D-alanine carboxypeptidase
MAGDIQEALEQSVELYGIRGATAAVVAVDTGTWSGATGVDVRGDPFTATTATSTASVGKTITAAQVLRLVDEGRLRLDDRAADHFPPGLSGVDANRSTIRDLLGMRSGLRDVSSYDALVDAGYTTAEVMKRLPEPLSRPGVTTEYANINYVLLGEIVEHVTGRRLPDVERSGVLAHPALDDLVHVKALDGWDTQTDPGTLARWGYELYGGFVLSDDALREMLDFDGEWYGLGAIDFTHHDSGARHDVPAVGHGGEGDSHAVRLVAFPESGVVVAIQANADDFEQLVPVADALREATQP